VTTTALAVIEPPVIAPPATSDPVVAPADTLVKETCPDCGRASVFAGPPGHRYCMHCALRNELFDRSASV